MLVRTGLIRAYVTVFDPAQVFAERNTILLMKTNPRELKVSESLLKIPDLESLDGISGDHSLLGLFRFRGSGNFEEFLNRIDRVVAGSSARTYSLVQVLATYKTHGFVIDQSRRDAPPLTPRDWDLIRVLYRHHPTEDRPFFYSQKEIGQKMRPGLTQPAVCKAMLRLEARGAIIAYSADIPFSLIGLPIKFFLQIKSSPGSIAESARHVSEMGEVWDLHRTSESYSLFATVRTAGVDEYNRFLRRLYESSDIEDTRSQISLEEWALRAAP
jgi:DNA-binding Lrp family transcriptional regulator